MTSFNRGNERLCTINICGLSERSNMLLNKYCSDENLSLVCIQETGAGKEWKTLHDMNTFEDTNKQANKGCAISVKCDLMFTQLFEISRMSSQIDTVWGILLLGGKKFLIGNVYLKLDYISGVGEFLAMLDKAYELSIRHSCAGVIAMGDFNARHFIWNDTMVNKYGKYLEDNLDWSKFCVQASSACTFLAKNGSSHIDFFITTTNLDRVVGKICANHFVNLHSGAPLRGHVPVTLDLMISHKPDKQATKKFDLKTMDWFNWTRDIELKLNPSNVDNLSGDGKEAILWEEIESTINKATQENCVLKTVTQHSKPYWTDELTELAERLTEDLKAYLTRNTDTTLDTYRASKLAFEEARKLACQNFIIKKTQSLNRAQTNRFWKDFNRLFKPPTSQQVEALLSTQGDIVSENDKIEVEMYETFFKARHIEENSDKFNNQFYDEINRMYNHIKENSFYPNPDCKDSFNHSSALYNPILLQEVQCAIDSIKAPAGSFDNCQFHPTMLKKLDRNAVHALSRLFSLCLRSGKFIWNEAKVIFLKKDGKPSYSKPGSYRPISISSYIGKLFERILASRLEKYLQKIGILDENQEGFSKGRNTIRYLHRLTAGIKGDISKKLTVLCLFVDFEKAFDSVWKQGLIVKLWRVGVHGCYLKTIDDFLFNRVVSLLINGFVGPKRSCSNYGLPQGSVLSPILFKFFVSDMEEACKKYKINIQVFKFADDGTAKVIGVDLEECLFYLDLVMGSFTRWTSCWRMVINCDVNKTEVVCFSSSDPTNVPNSFQLGDKRIQLTDHTKVLGVVLDKKLNFKEHSIAIYNKLIYRWVTMSRYTNRNWGMNQTVIARISKAIFFSSLFYGSIIWMNNTNMSDINSLWYKISKSAVGAVFNVSAPTLGIILGIPPLQITARVIALKHYLKVLGDEEDIHKRFVKVEMTTNTTVQLHVKEVLRYMKWRVTNDPKRFTQSEKKLLNSRDVEVLLQLTPKCFGYTKNTITKYTEYIWQDNALAQFQLEGYSSAPNVSCSPLPIPMGTCRESEVLAMSFFYRNNLLNSFLHKFDKDKWKSPLCACGEEAQTATHLLTNCSFVGPERLIKAINIMQTCNAKDSLADIVQDPFSILNCSRDPVFIALCLEIVELDSLHLRRKVQLKKKKNQVRQPESSA